MPRVRQNVVTALQSLVKVSHGLSSSDSNNDNNGQKILLT